MLKRFRLNGEALNGGTPLNGEDSLGVQCVYKAG